MLKKILSILILSFLFINIYSQSKEIGVENKSKKIEKKTDDSDISNLLPINRFKNVRKKKIGKKNESIVDTFTNKYKELKNELWETISKINVIKIGIFIIISIVLYLFLLFVIKILAKKFNDLKIIKKNLNKIIFNIIFILFWKQLPGGFSHFMVSISTFFLMVQLLKVMDYIVVDVIFIRKSKKEVMQIFRDIIKAILWIIIFMMMLKSIFGFSIQDIAITSAVVTAALAFSFQDTLINLISGISISAEKILKIGDYIKLKSGEAGTVIQTSWRTTKIKNKENQVIVVPNKELASLEIVNHTYYNQVGRCFTINISLKDDPNLVKKVILSYLKDLEDDILKYPHPQVFLKAYKEFYIEYEIRFFISGPKRIFEIDDKVKTGLWTLFKENNITIPYPVRVIDTLKKN